MRETFLEIYWVNILVLRRCYLALLPLRLHVAIFYQRPALVISYRLWIHINKLLAWKERCCSSVLALVVPHGWLATVRSKEVKGYVW